MVMAIIPDKDKTRIVTSIVTVEEELTTLGFEEAIVENPSPTR